MTLKALFEAADNWDAASLRPMLRDNPAHAGARDRLGRTALHRVAAMSAEKRRRDAKEALPAAKLLLDAGAELDAVRPIADGGEIFAATPLWYAVAHGRNLPLVKLFLRDGANPDWCLWAAVWNEDLQVLDALLKSKPQLDLIAEGETPLIYAVRLRRFSAMDRLISAGADLGMRDHKGRTAREIAEARRYSQAVLARLK